MYREYRGRVRHAVRRAGVLPQDIDDVVQDVFVVVHRRWDELANIQDVHPWIYGVALRMSCNYRRARRRWSRRFTAEHGDLDTFPATPAALLDDELTHHQRQRWLSAAVAQLDDNRREVVVLTQFEHRSAVEVSRMTGLSPNTVSSRLRAALIELRRTARRDAAACL
jgi:RNA polymerase sigma-70 factor (ECF subfamily)